MQNKIENKKTYCFKILHVNMKLLKISPNYFMQKVE